MIKHSDTLTIRKQPTGELKRPHTTIILYKQKWLAELLRFPNFLYMKFED